MVSVSVATQANRSGFEALLRFLQSKLFHVALVLRSVGLRKVFTRLVAAGSGWAVLAWTFGGFYDKPSQLPGVVIRVWYTIARTLCEYVARGFKPLFQEWTLQFELTRAVIRALTSNYGFRFANVKCAQHVRRQSEVAGSILGSIAARRLGLATESFQHNGLEHIWIRSNKTSTSPSDKPRRRAVVLYFHGGGYAVLSPHMYIPFACELQHRLHDRLRDKLGPEEDIDVEFLLANYRKIPEHPHPIPALDAVAMYKYLVEEVKVSPSEIIIAGDSAGGGLTMSTLLRIREENSALLPAAAILLCPFVDLEYRPDERKAPYCILGRKASVLTAIFHPHKSDPSNYDDASAVHCDLSGLPPVYIQAAEFDLLLPHSKRLYEKAKADGGTEWELEIFHNVPHVFSSFPSAILPSAARGLDAMAEFAATKLTISLKKGVSA